MNSYILLDSYNHPETFFHKAELSSLQAGRVISYTGNIIRILSSEANM